MMFHQSHGLKLFSFRGISVSITFWYALLVLIIAVFLTASSFPFKGLILAGAITVTLLIHEFGHAFMSRKFDLEPAILLHGFGGACIHEPAETDEKDSVVILAGPILGLAFSGLFLALFFSFSSIPGVSALPDVLQKSMSLGLWYLVAAGAVWNTVNLLIPIWPLDGGKLFHLFLRQIYADRKARDMMLKTSVCFALAVGVGGVAMFASLYIAIFSIFVIMGNVRALRSGQPLIYRPESKQDDGAEPNPFQENLLQKAEEAYSNGDWQEMYRLGHQIRSTGSVSSDALKRVWELLAIATTKLERYEEALKYIEQLPDEASKAVERARKQCERELTGEGRRETG